ncbi:MAG: glycosyltransferase family 2 protein [bacterium]|nr:glycosyltransferase family 2 protein [bacterium]
MAHISVVIPVYQAENLVDSLTERLHRALQQITPDYEVILVDDRSRDNSWQRILACSQRDKRVKGVRLARNFGQHHAITAGLDVANGEWVVVMDCDLQDEPEDIPRLYEKAQEGYQVVRAQRRVRNDPWPKAVTSRMFYALFNFMTGMHYNARVGNFRLISRNVADHMRQMREQTRAFSIMVDWLGFPTADVDVTHAARVDGKSTYTWVKLLRLAGRIIIAYSDKPLWLAVKGGFLMSLASILWGAWYYLRVLLYGCAVPGWASTIVSLYFLGGIIIGFLGIIGLYLAKIFDETKRRPLYAIDTTVNLGSPSYPRRE